ncbi:MAG: hypothetical protein K0R73_699 [Candidatus Midichloriaceae bacterium]|jgi:hypothetical protein|nr:hypothetical protein [Candidatus Midichloriaceae bacterium]
MRDAGTIANLIENSSWENLLDNLSEEEVNSYNAHPPHNFFYDVLIQFPPRHVVRELVSRDYLTYPRLDDSEVIPDQGFLEYQTRRNRLIEEHNRCNKLIDNLARCAQNLDEKFEIETEDLLFMKEFHAKHAAYDYVRTHPFDFKLAIRLFLIHNYQDTEKLQNFIDVFLPKANLAEVLFIYQYNIGIEYLRPYLDFIIENWGIDKDKIRYLISDCIDRLYEAKRCTFNDLKDLDIERINDLTSVKAQILYENGWTTVAELKALDTERIKLTISFMSASAFLPYPIAVCRYKLQLLSTAVLPKSLIEPTRESNIVDAIAAFPICCFFGALSFKFGYLIANRIDCYIQC